MTVLDVLAASLQRTRVSIGLPLPGTNASPKSFRSGDRSIIKRGSRRRIVRFGVYYVPTV
jgi:hypothetical protein